MAEDLTGKRFGRLTVLKEGEIYKMPSGKRHTWICKCDCGKIKTVLGQSLKSGLTKSCGCLSIEKAKVTGKENIKKLVDKSITKFEGKKFGRLTVISKTDKRERGSVVYLCKCDCGNDKYVSAKHLKDKTIQSCGCLVKDTCKEKCKELDLYHFSCFENTKICTLGQTINKNNTSGVRGVYFDNQKQRYVARISCQGKTYRLGSYKNIQDAANARKKAEEDIWEPIKDRYKGG